MALPREMLLDDDLAAFTEEGAEGTPPPAAGTDAYTLWKTAVERHAECLVRLQSRLTSMETKATALLTTLRRDAEAGRVSINLDELIDYYIEIEKEFARESLPTISSARRRKKDQFSLPVSAPDRSRAISVYDREIRIHTRALELIRDLRWQLMALRATLDSTADAPSFSDPQELKAYLDKL